MGNLNTTGEYSLRCRRWAKVTLIRTSLICVQGFEVESSQIKIGIDVDKILSTVDEKFLSLALDSSLAEVIIILPKSIRSAKVVAQWLVCQPPIVVVRVRSP